MLCLLYILLFYHSMTFCFVFSYNILKEIFHFLQVLYVGITSFHYIQNISSWLMLVTYWMETTSDWSIRWIGPLSYLFSSGCGLWVPNKTAGSQGKTFYSFDFPLLNFHLVCLRVRKGILAVKSLNLLYLLKCVGIIYCVNICLQTCIPWNWAMRLLLHLIKSFLLWVVRYFLGQILVCSSGWFLKLACIWLKVMTIAWFLDSGTLALPHLYCYHL